MRKMETLLSLAALMSVCVTAYSQSSLPSKEYIRLGARVIAIETPPPAPPSAASATLTPTSGTITSGLQTFSTTVTAGQQTIKFLQILIGAASDGGGSPFCFLHYDAHANELWMYSADLGFFLGPVSPETTSATLNSSYCAVKTSSTTVIGGGSNLTLSTEFLFKMAGARNGYVRVVTDSDYDTGWVRKDSGVGYMIYPAALQSMDVAPAAGIASSATVALSYVDQPGFGSPSINTGSDQFLIADAPDGGGNPYCFLHYDRAASHLYLYDRLTGIWNGPARLGDSITLSNVDCSISVAGASSNWSSGVLLLTVPLTLNQVMGGSKHKYIRSTDILGRDSGWLQRLPDWTIQGAPPTIPEFQIALPTSGADTLYISQTLNKTVEVTGSNGFNSTVSFSVHGLPAGITSQFSPPTFVGSGSTTMTLTPSRMTPNMNNLFTVSSWASINGITMQRAVSLPLEVIHPGLILHSPTQPSQGSSGSFAVEVTQPVPDDTRSTQVILWDDGELHKASFFLEYDDFGNLTMVPGQAQDFCSVTGTTVSANGNTLTFTFHITFDTSKFTGLLYSHYASSNSLGDVFHGDGSTFNVQ